MWLLSMVLAGFSSAPVGPSRCRCVPPSPCWDAVPWHALNTSTHGRLYESSDELAPCLDDMGSASCSAALAQTDNEFWLADQPNGFQHTGLYGVWNITRDLSSFHVRAETEDDFVTTVLFAAEHNLRLVVKNTGHDWYGRSTAAGSLMLWTHNRKKITFHTAFAPAGSADTDAGVPAVTVESGVQFSDLYPVAQHTPYPGDPANRKSIVMGGTCDSVGVAGCWLGGCYGPFTKKFGNGAVNLLEAKLVLPNGTLITASETSHPDVFWTLRGGGGGNIAVVTEFTARTHPAPNYMVWSSFHGQAKDEAGFRVLLDKVLEVDAGAMAWSSAEGVQDCGGAGPSFNAAKFTAGFGCNQWEGDADRTRKLYDPIVQWCKQPAQTRLGIRCTVESNVNWKQSDYGHDRPKWQNLSWVPWMELHPDREISTELLGSLTKYLPMKGMTNATRRTAMVDGIVNVDKVLAEMTQKNGGLAFTNCVMGAKSQSGLPAEIETRFNNTSNNPVLLDAVGLWLIYINIPSLPMLPPSSKLLATLWPRLQKYAILSPADPLWSSCEAGASGNESAAVACMDGWRERIPKFVGQVEELRDQLWKTFPNELDGEPYSGTYINEMDYADRDSPTSMWGTVTYARLLALKKQYDPYGLFYGHQAVGSELWDQTGNCPKV